MKQQGFVGLYFTIIVLILMLGIIAAVAFGIFSQQQSIRNIVQSAAAYSAAEAGAEDALLRLAKNLNWSSPYSISLWTGPTATITISPISGGARTITVEGDALSRFRKAEIVYELDSSSPGFFYGAHIGEGGLQMDNNSKVNGNVFSNGDIDGVTDALITGTAEVAGAGNQHQNVQVTGDLYTDHCDGATIGGTLYATTSSGCGPFVSTAPPASIPLPITTTMISDWKAEAAATTIAGSYTKSSGTHSLGPAKITGELKIQGTAQLVVTGTLWVEGNVTIQNDAQVKLDAGYGSTSGVILSDSLITLQDDSISSGSGSAGSYLMYLSTSPANPALVIQDDAQVDILYTNNGWILVQDDAHMREVSGYGVHLKNDVQITYEIGLETAQFTSGPTAGWTVMSWKETQ